ncbi:methyltransferase domain-containing protein [Streptomyces buecherae]|uniref:methyltransferase domain-containing protein n=1 Tax=Streptomyces buecherae TaxID=2763006 RepID=UPI0033D45B7C
MSSPAHLVEALANKRAIPPGWREAVASVPRELFLPDLVEVEDQVISRESDLEEWLEAVYRDVPVITQVNDGQEAAEGAYRRPTSSSSMPSVMLEMLDLLDVDDHHRVLELGAGTGYNAAWLAHRLGSHRVTSIEVDATLAEQARKNLAAAGYSPRIECGDGDAGVAGAPFDRLIATYTVPAIPARWIEQVPTGRIVAPWGGSFFSHSYAVLDTANGQAHGRFHGYPAFMASRTRRPHRGYLRDFLHHLDQGTASHTALSPLEIAHDSDALFFIALDVPAAWHLLAQAQDGSGEATWWLLADDRKSWAAVEYGPHQTRYEVDQYGPRRLWDEVQAAHHRWAERGRPGRDQAGLSVVAGQQRLWLDDPGNIIA